MEGVRDAVAGAGEFMTIAAFDPRSSICLGNRDGFMSRYTTSFKKYLADKKRSFSKGLSKTTRRD